MILLCILLAVTVICLVALLRYRQYAHLRELAAMRDHTRRECAAAQSRQETVRAEQGKGFKLMSDEQNEIALFLRANYAKEIAMGYHANRGLGAIVCGY